MCHLLSWSSFAVCLQYKVNTHSAKCNFSGTFVFCSGICGGAKRERSHCSPKVTSDSVVVCSIRYKPSSVPHRSAVFVIYLRLQLPATSSNLPLDIGRAALHASIYLVLHLVGCTARECRHLRGGLLPHLFTLTVPCGKAVIFCYTLPRPLEHLSVRKHDALRCSDFPPVGRADRRQTPFATFVAAKVTHSLRFTKKHPYITLWQGCETKKMK